MIGISLVAAAALLTPDFDLKSGDRVVFYGDSITQAGRFADTVYPEWVEAYAVTRFPDRDIRFVNVGWPGDSTWGGEGGSSEQRVPRDVGPVRATVVSIMLGMNDGGYVAYDPKIYDVWVEWYGKLLGWMHKAAPDARFTLIETSPYDQFTRDPQHAADEFSASVVKMGYNDVLLKFGRHVRELCDRDGYRYVDFNAPLVAMLKDARKRVPELASGFLPDHIHPQAAGHIVMATELLQSWNAPSLVSNVRVDLTRHSATADNATVTDIKGDSWTCLEKALPMPIDLKDAMYRFVTAEAKVRERISDERLTVEGLADGQYQLVVDDKPAGAFSASELAGGINLSEHSTPMLTQAEHVLDLVKKRNHIRHVRWHDLDWELAGLASTKRAAHELDDVVESLRKAEYAAAKPKAHHFSLKRV